MTNNFLKLNEDKTELIVVTSQEQISRSMNISINIGGHDIHPSENFPKNLGVIFDSTCSLSAHISKVCKSINYHLYSIGKVRKYMDMPTTEKMINALVTSRLDYCNSLFHGMSDVQLSRLQRCQNNDAKIITLNRKYDHITQSCKHYTGYQFVKELSSRSFCLFIKQHNITQFLHQSI